MIQHILKIIWNERKANIWIVLEFTLVFCLLWFCCDYLYYMAQRYYEPLGFDIEHTYYIYMTEREQSEENSGYEYKKLAKDEKYTYALTLIERLKQHPDVEFVSLSSQGVPYARSRSAGNIYINEDTASIDTRIRYVSTDFFDVFKMKIKGTVFDWTDPAGQTQLLITPNEKGFIGYNKQGLQSYPITDVRTIKVGNGNSLNVIGQTEKIKDTYYSSYESGIFLPLRKEFVDISFNQIIIRVRPDVGKDFKEHFTKEMRTQLKLGPYLFANITSLEEIRKETVKSDGVTGNLNSTYAIALFLIVNIFLGIIGVFWYRTEARKSEIGLRIALGASKLDVKKLMYAETLLLLFISSLIGVNVCINIEQLELLKLLGIPEADKTISNSGIKQYFINYVMTFTFLATVSLLAVWYPAKQSSDVYPAEVLHEE